MFYSVLKSLSEKLVKVKIEMKNDIEIKGNLVSVDNNLNIALNNVSVDEARAIRNEIGAYVKLVAKEYDKDYELYKMDETIACYYLWNLKKDSSIISLSDMVYLCIFI